LALLVIRPQVHDAAGRVVDEPKCKASTRLTSDLMGFVEGHGSLPRSAQPADHAQFAAGDHCLFDNDVGKSRRAQSNQYNGNEPAVQHPALPTSMAKLQPRMPLRQLERCSGRIDRTRNEKTARSRGGFPSAQGAFVKPETI
jgi:hypothetical protein